jgi:hypothetical protein
MNTERISHRKVWGGVLLTPVARALSATPTTVACWESLRSAHEKRGKSEGLRPVAGQLKSVYFSHACTEWGTLTLT